MNSQLFDHLHESKIFRSYWFEERAKLLLIAIVGDCSACVTYQLEKFRYSSFPVKEILKTLPASLSVPYCMSCI
jgi:hypothetical protein